MIHLMSKGSASLIDYGVIVHPGPESVELYKAITKPTIWLLADHDMRFKEAQQKEVKDVFAEKKGLDFDMVIYNGTSF